ncbi:hypothetical protein OAF27_01380, partial [Verrucomicrobiales bacterium]|nr:hypothetical protein [Verrucomicrobiales bacterium]
MKLLHLSAALSLLIFTGCGSGGGKASGEKVGKFVILGTKTDGADETAAKKNAENTLLRYPEVGALVGLWGYNTPQCLEAVRDAGKLGEVK